MELYDGQVLGGRTWPLPKREPKSMSTKMKNGCVLTNPKINGVITPSIRLINGTLMSLRPPIHWTDYKGEKVISSYYFELNNKGGRDNGGDGKGNWHFWGPFVYPKGELPSFTAFIAEKANQTYMGLLNEYFDDLYILFDKPKPYTLDARPQNYL